MQWIHEPRDTRMQMSTGFSSVKGEARMRPMSGDEGEESSDACEWELGLRTRLSLSLNWGKTSLRCQIQNLGALLAAGESVLTHANFVSRGNMMSDDADGDACGRCDGGRVNARMYIRIVDGTSMDCCCNRDDKQGRAAVKTNSTTERGQDTGKDARERENGGGRDRAWRGQVQYAEGEKRREAGARDGREGGRNKTSGDGKREGRQGRKMSEEGTTQGRMRANEERVEMASREGRERGRVFQGERGKRRKERVKIDAWEEGCEGRRGRAE
ncbi:hypothetical protein DFH09DRAFT_1289481 [Mycena vulgaris]|nr:hypothetical protein DFH09DRAFT_1289481 [Mycena vulgaris]